MPSLKYLIKRISKMDYSSMLNRVNLVNIKTRKPKALIFLDMIWSGIVYGAGYVDYDVIGFYKLNHKQRTTMLTRAKNDKIVKKLNNKDYWHLFNNKNEFNEYFSDFIYRDWIYLKKEKNNENTINIFKDFISKNPIFFAKPNDGQCGKGIEKIDTATIDISADRLLQDLQKKGLELYEAPIIQNDIMNELNNSSVNTIRMVTVMNEQNEVTILASYVRIGNNNIVDNFNSGGMTAKVDIQSGKIIEDAIDKNGDVYKYHPTTNTQIIDFQIPYYNESKEMVKKAAKLSKNVRYVGWDVAISSNGPTLVEGNQYPGHDIYQVAEKIGKNDLGVWPEFKKAMK